MRLFRLYIENFECHEKTYLNFSEFNSALIVGKKENSDLVSNGVGKTTIFRAIEYVLFNQSDNPLEEVIRDDTLSCRVSLDFFVDGVEYRLSRTRTKKGSTDLSLLQRTTLDGAENEVYHNLNEDPLFDEKFWKDLSGRRTSDTEKELNKLIKITFQSFRSIIHFLQRDYTSLTDVTPEKRKGILKDALNLIVYAKLEKLAKEKYNLLLKDIERSRLLDNNLGDPVADILQLNTELQNHVNTLYDKGVLLETLNSEQASVTEKINELVNIHSNLESKFSSLLDKEKTLTSEKSRAEISVKEYTSKKMNISKSAKDLLEEIKQLKEQQTQLAQADYSQIDILNETVASKREAVTVHNVQIQNNMSKYEELKITLPSDGTCKHCRQPLTDEHRKICQNQIDKEGIDCQVGIKNAKAAIQVLNTEITGHQLIINELNLSKQKLEGINTKISTKNKEVVDKKTLYQEYCSIFEKHSKELVSKTEELEEVQKLLQSSAIEEAKKIQFQIENEKKQAAVLNGKISTLNKEIAHANNSKAVITYNLEQKTKDKQKKEDLVKSIVELELKTNSYPTVIQAFSSTGIPNLIIQNILDDLQVESNNFLSQLKPGLQLSFFIEKTKADGTTADTLDINYSVNGRKRYFKQLSGAMQIAVTFSLKLGLSIILQRMIGTDIKFLLLDELDAALDKASVDAFSDIIKFLQKDHTILVITHNDRLKDKFSHAILVEQDINMVSRAKVVSSW